MVNAVLTITLLFYTLCSGVPGEERYSHAVSVSVRAHRDADVRLLSDLASGFHTSAQEP